MISNKNNDLDEVYFDSTGQIIRKVRERKEVTVQQLAAKCGITKGAVSMYENDLREVSDEKRKVIADALGVSDRSLKDFQLHDLTDILFLLFKLQRRGYLNPVVTEDSVGVQIANPLLHDALLAWNEKYQQKENGTLSQEEYDEWIDSFSLKQAVPPERINVQFVNSGNHADEIRSLQMLRQTMEYDIERVEYYIEKDDIMGIVSVFEVLKMNLLTWLDREVERLIEKNKRD